MKFLLGSDPELMLINVDTNQLVSAIPFIDGKKDAPTKIPDGAVIHDNVNLEFGIDPADDEDSWVEKTGNVLQFISKMLPANLKMVVNACADFPQSELEHPEAREFACDPDFDPYSLDINYIAEDASGGTLRSCGGHVHIGSDIVAKNAESKIETAKVMDIFLGLPSLIVDKDPSSHRRRTLYGKAGAHRPKPYGVEYRSIGNFWIENPEYTRLVYKLVRDGLAAWEAGHLNAINWDRIRSAINSNDVKAARGAIEGLIKPLSGKDTSKLLDSCIKMKRSDIYSGWGF